MKNLRSFLGTIAIIAAQALLISVVFCLLHWLFSKNETTWLMFFGGAVTVFIFLLALYGFHTCKTMWRFHKDPEFKEAYIRTGIEWKDYKRLTENKKYENRTKQELISIVLAFLVCVLAFFVCVLASCQHHQLGEYVYVDFIKQPPCFVVHADKKCGNNAVIKPVHEIYQGKSEYNIPYDFCARCISDEQMKQIEDSIAKYRNDQQ